ncbi:uncharacterized protein DS421_3g78120 [Arachis hypogaea]|nr:uncharacterized protein DS421_3g78120 [Arachis hypogaea]
MTSLSSVAGWSSSLCVAHMCSILLHSSALPIASLVRLASARLAVPCLKSPLLDSAFCCLDWFCNNRNKERGEIGDKHTGSTCKSLGCNPQSIAADRLRCLVPEYRRSVVKAKASNTTECAAMVNTNSRRDSLGLALGISSLFVGSLEAKGAGLL